MKKSENKAVHSFLRDLESVDVNMFNVLTDLREIMFKYHPEAEEKIMYGGIIFSAGDKMFSGVFAYKKHVSIEFSNGYLMKDPKNLLEGKGKFRRHLKLYDREEVLNKDVAYYIKQSLK